MSVSLNARQVQTKKSLGTRAWALMGLGFAWALGSLGCAMQQGEPPSAVSSKVESLINVGDAHLREGRYPAAMQHYMEAEAIDPKNAEVKFRIALVYVDHYKRLDEGIRYYEEAVRLRSNYSEAYNNLGVVYSRMKRWDEAIAMFQKALGNLFYATPEFAHYNMGLAYQGKGDTEKAIEHFKAAIDLKGQYVDPYLALGGVYQETGRDVEALQAFQRARSILEKREPKAGRSSQEEIELYRSTLAAVCFHQGVSLARLKRVSEAREAYERALETAVNEEMRRQIQKEISSLPSQ
ncbi:MAG: tetratricopeptide repeat protein [Thermodesulfobacteriota bacterium]